MPQLLYAPGASEQSLMNSPTEVMVCVFGDTLNESAVRHP